MIKSTLPKEKMLMMNLDDEIIDVDPALEYEEIVGESDGERNT